MDVHDALADLTRSIETARAMPMSASCVINRQEVLAQIEQIRAALPQQLVHADLVLADRAAVLAEAGTAAQEVLASADAEAARRVAEHQIVAAASRRADELVAAAEAEAERLRRQSDEYADARLADLEAELERTGRQVRAGRSALAARRTEVIDVRDAAEVH